jgi:hypothetical protein
MPCVACCTSSELVCVPDQGTTGFSFSEGQRASTATIKSASRRIAFLCLESCASTVQTNATSAIPHLCFLKRTAAAVLIDRCRNQILHNLSPQPQSSIRPLNHSMFQYICLCVVERGMQLHGRLRLVICRLSQMLVSLRSVA